MKKIAYLVTMAMLVSLFSFSVFAAELNTNGSDTLNASKDVAYTLSIPSGTKEVQIVADAQEIGEIGLTAANFTSGSVDVAVTSANSFSLKNGEVTMAYTLDATENKYSFNQVAALTKVKLTITDVSAATIAGTYTDTLTFTATANNVQ